MFACALTNGSNYVALVPVAATETDNNSLNFFLTTPPLQKWLGIDHICSVYVGACALSQCDAVVCRYGLHLTTDRWMACIFYPMEC